MFGRRSTPPESDVSNAVNDLPGGGKGRPTPTRKEAEAARKQRLTVPRTRKEQAAARRTQTQIHRDRQRQAMATGDDSYLPTRDKGPVRRFARDYVDSRWCIGEILLPLFFVVFAIMTVAPRLTGFASSAWLAVLGLMAIDGVRLVRGVRAGVRQRFGETDTKGLAMYVIMRAWQMRRLRLPKPLVKHGASI